MKRKMAALGILLLALAGKSANAEPGFFDRLLPASAMESLRSLKESLTPASADDKKAVFTPLALPNHGGGPQPQQPPHQQPPRQEPPRQEPPRQQPPRQEPPRQQPPRQEPPRQQPPRQEPPRQQPPRQEPPRQQPQQPQRPPQQPPHRDPVPAPQPPHRDPNPAPAPQPPHRNPNPTPAPQPPHRDPNPTPAPQPPHRNPNPTPAPQPPHRDPNPAPAPQPPHRNPNPTPAPQPPHRDPNPTPAPQPPHRDPNPPHRDPNPAPRCPDPRNPRCPQNPQRPPAPPPVNQHPPVVVHPQQPGHPGNGDHRMPDAPKPLPGGGIDPRHHGDDRAVHPPHDRDGHQVPQQPWKDHNGRVIPPDHDRIGRIDRGDMRDRIHGEQDHWNRNDHDYHWHDWNGMPVCHHYDDFGYHWWGFYVGNSYFWTRYDNDMYWWYDPYWHRWVFLRDNRWWWQDNGITYVMIDNNYYRYGNNDGTVVVTPDPTAPVDVPPAEPNAPAPETNQTMFYSLDGTRSVQILGDRKEAYLYDLTIADQNDREARGRWLGTGVASAKFVTDDKIGDDGSPVQVLRQIELTFDDASKSAVADVNGEREVVVSGDARSADLLNLKDDTIAPVRLTDGETGVTLFNEDKQGTDGVTRPSLLLVIVTATNEATGVDDTLTFDRNGAPYTANIAGAARGASQPLARRAAAKSRQLQEKVQASETLRALSSGFSWQ
ncbi:MAG: hypothetical protein ACHQ51_04450 [Elusimicrobiota bacterium]